MVRCLMSKDVPLLIDPLRFTENFSLRRLGAGRNPSGVKSPPRKLPSEKYLTVGYEL